ncbi:hypothetical protein DL767_004643 [Monosporascus sp. MG133]|nr:hypothetical protein DL767_004643 [Monosporascus sp. MG133]
MSAWTHLQDLLRARAESDTARHLLVYSPGDTTNANKISYSRLYNEAKQASIVIQSLEQFQKGHPVLLYLDDHWDTILWFWAVLLANGLPVLSPSFSNIEEQRHKYIQGLSSLLESPICVTRSRLLYLFGQTHGIKLFTIEWLLSRTMNPDSTTLVHDKGYVGGQECTEKGATSSVAMLMLTSGSTGSSKAALLTHKQILASVAGKSSARQLPLDKPFLNWIGLDHVGALVEIHLHALWLGVDQIHVSTADMISSPLKFIDLLSRHQVSRSFAPNFFLARLITAIPSVPQSTWDLSSLSFLVSGGEANDVKTCRTLSSLLASYGAPLNAISPGFGMTETCAGAIYNTDCPDYDITMSHAVASLGKCIKGIEMRIMTPGSITERVTPGKPGELQVRGPIVFGGYYRNNDATRTAFTPDGWFRTGDQGIIDINGNLSLIGRYNDIININGIKVLTADIQTALEQAFGGRVARIVVFATRTGHTEQVTITYIPKEWPINNQDLSEIHDIASEICMLSTASQPLIFPISEESLPLLPISSLGKISSAKMRSLFEEGKFEKDLTTYSRRLEGAKEHMDIESQPATNETETLLIKDFAETLNVPPGVIGIHTRLVELGATSMDLIKLKHRIDTRLGIRVPIITILKNPTAMSLATALSTHLSKTGSRQALTYDPVVTFHEGGTKTPLWLVHPGVGEVLVFIGLARHLGDDDRPLFALRARGFENGHVCFESIRETVEVYTTAIRRQQPRGPYALAGYSYGSMLAFEIAKKLDYEDGIGTVRFLGSFNLPPHIKLRMRQLDWNMCLLNLAYFVGLTTQEYAQSIDEQEFRALSRAAALQQLLSIADRSRWEELELSEEYLARWVDVAYGLQSMATEYEPEGQVESVDVFHSAPLVTVARSREVWVRDHLSKWSNFSRTAPVFHEVGGSHYTMIGSEHVDGFSIVLKSALKERGV